MSKAPTLDTIFSQSANAMTDALQTTSAPNWWPIDQASASGTTTFPVTPTATFSAHSTLTVATNPMKNTTMAGAGKLILTNVVGAGGFSARYYEHPDYQTVDKVTATIDGSGNLSVTLWQTTLQFSSTTVVANYDPSFVYYLTLKIYSNFCGVTLTKLINNQPFGYAASLVVPGIAALLQHSSTQGLVPGVYKGSIVTQDMLNFCNICLLGTTNATLQALGQDIPSAFNALHRKHNIYMRDLTTVGATLSYIHDTAAPSAVAQFVTQARNIAVLIFDWNTHSTAADAKSKIASTAGILSRGGYEVWVVAMYRTSAAGNAITEEVNEFIRSSPVVDRVIDLSALFPAGLTSGVDVSLASSMAMFTIINKVIMASGDAVASVEKLNASEKVTVNTSSTALTNANLGVNTDGHISLFNTTQNYIKFAKVGYSDGPVLNTTSLDEANVGIKLLLANGFQNQIKHTFPCAIGVGLNRLSRPGNLWFSAESEINFLVGSANYGGSPTTVTSTNLYTPTITADVAELQFGVFFSTTQVGPPTNAFSDRVVFSSHDTYNVGIHGDPTAAYKIGLDTNGIYLNNIIGGQYKFVQGVNLMTAFGGALPTGSPTADTGFTLNQQDHLLVSASAAQTEGGKLDLAFPATQLTGVGDTAKWRISVDASNNLQFGVGSPVTNYMSITSTGTIKLSPNTTANHGIQIDRATGTVDGQNTVAINRSSGTIVYTRGSTLATGSTYQFQFSNTCITTTSVIQLTLSFQGGNASTPQLILSYFNQIAGGISVTLYNAGPTITSSSVPAYPWTSYINFSVF